jgi:predicted transcriptional regulator
MEHLLKEFKDVFAWTYKNLKGIPLELAQHIIELDNYYTIDTSCQVQIKSELWYNGQTRYK